jgi:Tfp pilus assembly protein PilN
VNKRLNVATRPFTNRALPWVIAVIFAFFSLVAMVFIAQGTTTANSKTEVVRRDISTLNQELQVTEKKAEEVKRSFTQEQLQSLKSAHQLADRKRFSWSRLFADLEAVLPGGVRVTRITVRQLGTEGGRTVADLELAVVSKSYSTIDGMITSMDQQGTFRAELRNQNLQKGKGEGGTEYDLMVHYTPKAGYTVAPAQPARAAIEPAAITRPGGSQ